MNASLRILFALVFLLAPSLAGAAENTTQSAEARLREGMRNAMLQLRDAQNQVATLQATQADLEREKGELGEKLKELTAQLDNLAKQSAVQKEAADKAIKDLNAKVTDKDSQVARLTEALEKWKAGYNQVVNIARTKEAERARLETEGILLQRKVEDREAKNLELFQVSNEILTRYEKFSLGDALAAKEPFIGTTRVKLENLVQGYQDKILTSRVTPGEPLPDGVAPSKTETARAKSETTTTASNP